jgi:hypothetical protein
MGRPETGKRRGFERSADIVYMVEMAKDAWRFEPE